VIDDMLRSVSTLAYVSLDQFDKVAVCVIDPQVQFVIIEHARDVERKGIRILCFVICLHRFNTMYFGKGFALIQA
jgi:hypothetical protein